MSHPWASQQTKPAHATTGTPLGLFRGSNRSRDRLSCHVEEVHWYCVKCPVGQRMMLPHEKLSQEARLQPGALRGLGWPQVDGSGSSSYCKNVAGV